MEETLHSLLDQWENHLRDHPNAEIIDFLGCITKDVDREMINRFQVAVAKLNRIDRRIKQIGVDTRKSD